MGDRVHQLMPKVSVYSTNDELRHCIYESLCTSQTIDLGEQFIKHDLLASLAVLMRGQLNGVR